MLIIFASTVQCTAQALQDLGVTIIPPTFLQTYPEGTTVQYGCADFCGTGNATCTNGQWVNSTGSPINQANRPECKCKYMIHLRTMANYLSQCPPHI